MDANTIHKLAFFAQMGATLLEVQMTETILRRFTVYFFNDDDMTWDAIRSQAEKRRKDTLGRLIIELRHKFHVAPEFDRSLSSFLENRNTFAHAMSKVPGYALETEAGRHAGVTFLRTLAGQAKDVRDILMSYLRLLFDQEALNGVEIKPDMTEQEMVNLMALLAIRRKR